jgi:tripartite-type tricarboxylate transporter receptor subunit TctC
MRPIYHQTVARKTMPANDLQGLIAWLKANPDMATEGTAGVGSAMHVGGVLFQKLSGTRFRFVPYNRGQAMLDLERSQSAGNGTDVNHSNTLT